MADEPTKTPGSITEQADNSNERISEVSNVNRTISNMQKKVDQQLSEMSKDVGSAEAISSIQNSMVKVLHKLSITVGDIGKGFGKVSVDVAKSSKDVISQYGKAISQDVNYNKENIVAMALSKSTPIYGYFISKFMETNVWKSASERMKENIGNTLSSVGQKLKNVIGDLKFSKGSKKDTDSLSKQTRSIKVPHMAKGGIVEKAGLAKLHAAEVVMPVDKLLSRIDDQLAITKTMAKTVEQGQLHSMSKMNSYVGSLEQYQKRGLVKSFFNALKDVQTQYEEPAQERMLRALLSIQDALGAQIGTWTQVWQKMLIQNPVFRNAMLMGNLLKKTLAAPFAPIYSIFKGHGGYKGQLSKSNSPLEALNENIGMLYTGSMFRLDAIATYTKATAEATRDLSSTITGAKYEALPGIKTGRWSIFGIARKVLNFGTKYLVKSLGSIVSIPIEYAHLGPKFDKIADLLTKQINLPKIKSRGIYNDAYGIDKPKMEWGVFFDKYFPPAISNIIEKQNAIPMFDINATTIKTEQEKIANTSEKLLKITDKTWRNDIKDFNLSKKSLKYAEANLKENKQANERGRRQSIFGFLSGGFGAAKGLLGSAMGFIKPLLTGGMGALFGGGILTSVTTFLSSAPFIAAVGTVLATAFAGAAGVALGKIIDKSVGITKTINNWYVMNETEGEKLRSDLGKRMKQDLSSVKTKGPESEKSMGRLQYGKLIGKEDARRRKDVGILGRMWVDQVQDAQYKYLQDHVNEYMKYTPDTVASMRSQWLDQGGFRPGHIKENIQEYGAKREAAFLKFLKTKKPLEMHKISDANKNSQAKKSTLPRIKDSAIAVISRTNDLVKHQVSEAILTTQGVAEVLKATTANVINASKEAAGKLGDAVNQNAIVVSNTITNTSSTVNGSPTTRFSYNPEDQYNNALIRGDIDGD